MISGSGRCSECGGVEFHVIPTDAARNPSGPARWECERCGRIRNNYGAILVPGHYDGVECMQNDLVGRKPE